MDTEASEDHSSGRRLRRRAVAAAIVTADDEATETESDDCALPPARRAGVKRHAAQLPAESSGVRTLGVGIIASAVCICQRSDPFHEHLVIPCHDGRGGCNGWVHPQCVAMPAALWMACATEQIQSAASPLSASILLAPYICPLCIHLTATAGAQRAPLRTLLPPPLTHPMFVLEKILGHRRQPRASSVAVSAPGSALSLAHMEGHAHLVVEESNANPGRDSDPTIPDAMPSVAQESLGVAEFLCKWKGRSYMHCSWETFESLVDLEDMFLNSPHYDAASGQGSGGSRAVCAARVNSRIERYKKRLVESSGTAGAHLDYDGDEGLPSLSTAVQPAARQTLSDTKASSAERATQASMYDVMHSLNFDDDDREWFDPEFTFPERVLKATVPLGEDYFDTSCQAATLRTNLSAAASSLETHADGGALAACADLASQPRYLVKWRGLPYNECTWESGADVGDDDLLREFRLRESLPDDCVVVQVRESERER
jgi:hypothetical protein